MNGWASSKSSASIPTTSDEASVSRLSEHAIEHMWSQGMDIGVVETGGDPRHASARATDEAGGFTQLPIARYFRLLD